jgi:methionyl-tRNA formyltransferase
VLAQRATPVREGETAGELGERLAELSGALAVDAVRSIDDGSAVFTPQDPARVTFCRRLSKEDGALDWNAPAEVLERHVRAMNPWPGARTTLPGGAPLGVWRARVLYDLAGAPGTVLETSGRLVVACGSGALELERVQAAGKRALDTAEWLRGARLERGATLGSA